MDGSQESSSSSSGSPAPFLTKTYDMVEDPSTDSIVSWSSLNNSFVVWNALEFARELLPKYFKHNNFSSFIRQLNTYGFRKIDPDQWEFANDEFIRGQRHLLKSIHRRKPIHSHSLQPHGHSSLTEAERQELEEEIEKLKHEKNMLFLVQQRRVQQRHQMDLQIQSLRERLHTLQDRHWHVMKFLAQIIRKPDFLPDLVKGASIQVKKRRLLGYDHFHEDANVEEHKVVSFQGVPITKSDTTPLLDTDPFDKMELSLISLEKFIHRVSQASGIEMHDAIAASSPSTVVLTEMRPSWSDPDVRVLSQSPRFRPSSPSSGDTNSCTDLATSVNCADSPVIPQINHMESQPKISEIDVNMEPVAPEVSSFGDRSQTAGGSAPNVSAGANDVFWQQFLTETPGSSDTQEVESQRRDSGTRRGDAEARPRGDYWWNKKNVDSVSKKVLQLASAGRT